LKDKVTGELIKYTPGNEIPIGAQLIKKKITMKLKAGILDFQNAAKSKSQTTNSMVRTSVKSGGQLAAVKDAAVSPTIKGTNVKVDTPQTQSLEKSEGTKELPKTPVSISN